LALGLTARKRLWTYSEDAMEKITPS